MKIWVLKARWLDDDDEVFLFATEDEAKKHVYIYFQQVLNNKYNSDLDTSSCTIDNIDYFYTYLCDGEIGSFEIEAHDDPLSRGD